MFTHNISPILATLMGVKTITIGAWSFTVGPLAIRYYSLAYILGALFTYFFFYYLIKKGKIKFLDREKLDSLILYIVIGLILGARLGFFLFYKPWVAWTDPIRILTIWRGGMSFHGGMIGCTIAGILFARKHKISFYKIADIVMVPAALSLFFGRIANFINGEVVGIPSTVPWCVVFPTVDDICRHPSQLYEAMKNLLLFGITWFTLQKTFMKKYKEGTTLWTFITFYGLFRFLVTFLREDSRWLGISWGQTLSLIMFVIGGIVLIRNKFKKS
jgi:phosphatidylglycerol---prolipoprotein diacylglyceryl transferase